MKSKIVFLVALLFIFMACGGDEDPMTATCDTVDMTYTDDISTIVSTSCARSGCHVDGGEIPFLHDYASLKAEIDDRPGRLIGSIKQDDGFLPMPRISSGSGESTMLEDCKIDKIEAWVNDGAPE